MILAMQGGWEINPPTTEEQWYFSKDNTFVRLTRYDEQFGTWRLEGQNAIINTSNATEGQVVKVVVDNNVMILGALSLVKDSSVIAKLEKRLSDKLIGVWKSDIEEVTYEFMPNGFMLIKYKEGITEDGKWRISGNRLIENESEYGAAPISFDGNKLNWSTESFVRVGDARAVPLDTDDAIVDSQDGGATQTLGQPIRQHSFQANLGNFGEVIFEPYWEDRFGASKLHLYLTRSGVPVYELPAFSLAEGKFDGLRSAASRDINSDGKLDILVMADYLVEGPESAEQVKEINGVYLNKGASFSFDRSLSQRVNQQKNIRDINDLVAYARTNVKSSTGGNSTTRTVSNKTASSSNSLSKYIGDKSICRIRIAALKGNIDYDKLAELQDLGVLSFEPADNGYTRIYLGKYLGKYTAYQILNKVKARGHKSAFVVVEQDFINTKTKEEPAFSTYQVSASRNLNVASFNELDDQFRGDVYITYSGGRYRVSLGVFQRELYPYMEQEFATLGTRLGFSGGFASVIK